MANLTDTIAPFERLLTLIDRHPRRAIITIPVALVIAALVAAVWQAPNLIALYEAQTDREYER